MARRSVLHASEKLGALRTGVPTVVGWAALFVSAGLFVGHLPDVVLWLSLAIHTSLTVAGGTLLWLTLRASQCDQFGDVYRAYRFARAARVCGGVVLVVAGLSAAAVLWFRDSFAM